MKNNLIYFYGININEIKKIKEDYYFIYNNSNFIITEYKRNEEEAVDIYKLSKELTENNYPTYEILMTKMNSILFEYENKKYILMKMPKINNRFVTYEDIINFNYTPKDQTIINMLDKSNWGNLWEKKIDSYEEEYQQIKKKHPKLVDSMNYYIGISENAISYFHDNIQTNSLTKVVSHIRISPKMDLYDFYNPLNLIIDYKERDIGEFLKEFSLYENYTNEIINEYISMKNDNKESIMALICRILFASYYFDQYEEIISNNKKEAEIEIINKKRKNISLLIKLIFKKYNYLNIPYINWIMIEN